MSAAASCGFVTMRLIFYAECVIFLIPERRRTHRPGLYVVHRGELLEVGPPMFLFAVDEVLQSFAELLYGLALVSEYQEPEPFSIPRFLYQQLTCVWRCHLHLPFLDALRRFAVDGRVPLTVGIIAWNYAAVKHGIMLSLFCTKHVGMLCASRA